MHILCDNGDHHFLLSSSQFCPWPLKATEAKYGKFAYSSSFGFSVPTGPLLPQMAPDSTLALSNDNGETWKVRWKAINARTATAILQIKEGEDTREQEIPVLVSGWKPWQRSSLHVETTLVPPTVKWSNWHIRRHVITWKLETDPLGEAMRVQCVEGGFAISGRRHTDGGVLPNLDESFTPCPSNSRKVVGLEGVLENKDAAIISSSAGVSGIRNLQSEKKNIRTEGEILIPDANTNLMVRRTLIPTIKQDISMDGSESLEYDAGKQICRREIITAVIAMAKK